MKIPDRFLFKFSTTPEKSVRILQFTAHRISQISTVCHTISFIMAIGSHSLNFQLSASHDASSPLLKDTSTTPSRSTSNAMDSRRKIVLDDELVHSPYSLSSLKKGDGGGICSDQILIFIMIVTHVSLYQDRPERNSKPEHLPKTTSVRTEEKARVSPRDHFRPSHSSRCRTLAKALCGSGVPIPITQAHYEVFHLHYLIQLSSKISRSVESITLSDHSYVLNNICLQSSVGCYGWRQIFLHVNHNNQAWWSEKLQKNHNV